MRLHPPAHKHVGDAGKPGQIVNHVDRTDPLLVAPFAKVAPQAVARLRDLMYQHGISPFNPAQKQARTLKDTL